LLCALFGAPLLPLPSQAECKKKEKNDFEKF